MAELLDAPKYYGNQEMFEADVVENLAIPHYFKHKRVCDWSLSDFLVANNDYSDFVDGSLSELMGLFEHLPTHGINILQGNAGALRIVTAKEAAMNFIRNAKLAEQAYGLAQTDMIEVMKKRQVKAEQALRGLGKHPREPEEDDAAHSAGKPLVKKEASLLYDTDKEEDAETKFDLDAASTAQELCHLPLNLVFDMDDSFSFHGSLGDIDLSDMFTKYYAECLGLPYDADNMADFLAIAGILFLTKRPTALQKKCFGDTYDAIHKKMKKLQPTVFRDEERRSEDKNKAQKALRRRALEEDESALTELYLYGSKLHTICNPLSEADQISGFVLRMLSCVTDQADETRLAYTPTTPTTGSPFIRLFQNIKSEPRHPDLILKHKEEHDIGFGE
ncbi:hypothetical protein BGW41_006805, partial [Actinomortierella wolfii]